MATGSKGKPGVVVDICTLSTQGRGGRRVTNPRSTWTMEQDPVSIKQNKEIRRLFMPSDM